MGHASPFERLVPRLSRSSLPRATIEVRSLPSAPSSQYPRGRARRDIHTELGSLRNSGVLMQNSIKKYSVWCRAALPDKMRGPQLLGPFLHCSKEPDWRKISGALRSIVNQPLHCPFNRGTLRRWTRMNTTSALSVPCMAHFDAGTALYIRDPASFYRESDGENDSCKILTDA